MNSIEILTAEHKNILRFNRTVRGACLAVLAGQEPCAEDFREMIGFVRNYADKHHHGKEEQILFKEMTAQLGQIGANLITHGMLVEHDLARLHIADLEEALNEYEAHHSAYSKLDILASAVGYTKLLNRHIEKENLVVYAYAEKHLPADVLAGADQRMAALEEQAQADGVQKKYLEILTKLEQKYQ